MKVYKGLSKEKIGKFGIVTVNGKPLFNHEKNIFCGKGYNFGWGYGGEGPTDLSISIAIDIFGGDNESTREKWCIIKEEIVKKLPDREWEISEKEIIETLEKNGITID